MTRCDVVESIEGEPADVREGEGEAMDIEVIAKSVAPNALDMRSLIISAESVTVNVCRTVVLEKEFVGVMKGGGGRLSGSHS